MFFSFLGVSLEAPIGCAQGLAAALEGRAAPGCRPRDRQGDPRGPFGLPHPLPTLLTGVGYGVEHF